MGKEPLAPKPKVRPLEAIKPFPWIEENKQNNLKHLGISVCRHKDYYVKGINYFNESLEVPLPLPKEDDVEVINWKTKCYLELAIPDEGLVQAEKSNKLKPIDLTGNLTLCDCLYDLNEFEENKIKLSNLSRNYVGHRYKEFEKRLDIVNENYADILGEKGGPYMNRNRKFFEKLSQDLVERNNYIEPIGQMIHNCGGQSIGENVKIELPALLAGRKELNTRIILQKQFPNGWLDLLYLRDLESNPNLRLQQFPVSSSKLLATVSDGYTRANRVLKMLQTRTPMYVMRERQCSYPKRSHKIRQDHLHRVQYQTRLDTFNMLVKAKGLRRSGALNDLINFVEDIMRKYFVAKTDRVMPRKFEFINDLYNVVGLAYTDKLSVPQTFFTEDRSDWMQRLLQVAQLMAAQQASTQAKDEPIFGDRSTFKHPDEPDYVYLAYKKITTKLETRVQITTWPIERCYLYHEIGTHHLTQFKLEEAKTLSIKCVTEAQECGNFLWEFLAYILRAKAEVMQKNSENIAVTLNLANAVVQQLGSKPLAFFVEVCNQVNHADLVKLEEAKRERDQLWT